VDRLFIKCTVSLLLCYLHSAIFFFILGLLLFLFNLNLAIFSFTSFLLVLSLGVYVFLTILPAFQHNSLLYTPLSTFPISFIASWVCVFRIVFRRRFDYKDWGIIEWAFDDVGRKADKLAFDESAKIDPHVLDWSLRSLGDDDEVETYLRAIPEFFRGRPAVLESTPETKVKLKQTLNGFLGRTFSSNTDTEDVRNSRLIVGLDASHRALGLEDTTQILEDILKGKWPKLHSVEMGHSLISWGNKSYDLHIRSVVSCIIAKTPKPDDRCIALAMGQLDISDDRLRGYLSLPDSVSLVSFIDIAHRIHSQVPNRNLRPLHSRSNVPMELHHLQYDFCALWNALVQGNDRISIHILKSFHRAYMALHTVTGESPEAFSPSTADNVLNNPSSYPSCNNPDHNRYPIPQLYDTAGSNPLPTPPSSM